MLQSYALSLHLANVFFSPVLLGISANLRSLFITRVHRLYPRLLYPTYFPLGGPQIVEEVCAGLCIPTDQGRIQSCSRLAVSFIQKVQN